MKETICLVLIKRHIRSTRHVYVFDKMASCTITVDTRERGLYEILSGKVSDPISVVSAPMEVGDISIKGVDPTGQSEIILVFERKTGADLAASVKDGRYREQKMRLMNSGVSCKHITYIIENKKSCKLSSSVFHGVEVNTMYRDGIHIVYTKNVEETAEWLAIVADKIVKDVAKFASIQTECEYLDNVKVKTRKIENIDPKTCYILQLCQIPGVSTRIANCIQERYGTMYELLKALHDTENPIKALTSIQLVGDKKAKVILQYFGIGTPT